jgi:hypothetical protein
MTRADDEDLQLGDEEVAQDYLGDTAATVTHAAAPTAADEASTAPIVPAKVNLADELPGPDLAVERYDTSVEAEIGGQKLAFKSDSKKFAAAATYAILALIVGGFVFGAEWISVRHHVRGGGVVLLDLLAIAGTGGLGWLAIERWGAPTIQRPPS